MPIRPIPSLRAACLATSMVLAGAAVPPFGSVAEARPAPDSFADLAAKLLPSVVNISSTGTATDDADDDDDDSPQGDDNGDKNGKKAPNDAPQVPTFPPGSPFEKFFRDFMNKHRRAQPGQTPGQTPNGKNAPEANGRKMQSLGSGFIIDPSGLVVTNNHVIKGADSITVTLQDNTVLKAKLLGHDDKTDLALLKIDSPKPLPAVAFGNSDKERVGDWVLAIGNPFGLSGTVTAGIVSSRGRSLDSGPYDDFIQTDAPINRGNSGGPLFDMDGGVIGINTAIYSPSGGSIGIGFAIPSNEAKRVVDQLREFGKARRGWIGVRIQDVTQDIADGLGLPSPKGALIAGVDKDGPAAKAGLKSGDVIQQVGGQPADGRSLPRIVGETPIGTAVPVVIWRDGKAQTLQVTVRDFPEDTLKPVPAQPPKTAPTPSTVEIGTTGLTLAPIDDSAREKYNLGDTQKGAVVTAVRKNSPAAERGVHEGDVVVEVQQSAINDPADVRQAVEEARKRKRPSVVMLVQNGDGMRWVPLPVSDAK